MASGNGCQGSVTLHQEVDLFAGSLDAGEQVVHSLRAGRHASLQVARGAIMIYQIAFSAGDGVAVSDEPMLHIGADTGSEVLLFDLT